MNDVWTSECGRATLILGDTLEVLPRLREKRIQAIIVDPPYSSGGAFRSDRMQKTVDKYVNTDSGQREFRQEFSGDNRDQRGFFAWCALWLAGARRVTEPGGVLCSFIDWRQLPVLSDAVQAGGWVWRNVATWHKPGCRMQRGRFSASAEYVIYATNGPHNAEDGEKSPHNVFACQPVAGEDKEHIAEKPLAVMDWVMGVAKPGCLVFDPFCGYCSTGVAAIRSGRSFLGIEISEEYFESSKARLIEALREDAFLNGKKPESRQQDLFEL